MPRLILPTPTLHASFLAAHREWGSGPHEDGFGIGPHDDVMTSTGFAEWIARVRGRPGTSWWITDEASTERDDRQGQPKILGAIALRPSELTRNVVTGHIGYGVTPSARGRGLATWALSTVLTEAADRGMPSCVLVCLDDNVASIRTIEHCGGRLESCSSGPDGVRRRIYRVRLNGYKTEEKP